MELPPSYKGREQAYVKHTLLQTYLERLFMIIGQHEKTICYVDCFAGPWQEEGSELKHTSIAISLEIIQRCLDGLHKSGKRVKFRALYIERNKTAFTKLDTFLNACKKDDIEAKCLHGEFWDLRDDILKWCGNTDFVFFFIDPKGWKNAIEIPTLLPLLRRQRSEYLINFMYKFLVRTHTQTGFADDIKAIFGDFPDTHGMKSKDRESFLLRKYREQLKQAQPGMRDKPRSAYVAVLDPIKDSTKYHLVYLTRHALGIKVFMEASEKVDLVQRTVRRRAKLDKRVEQTGQFDIFARHEDIEQADDHVDIEEVKKYWLKLLSSTPRQFDIMSLADMLEETGWFISDFQEAFRDLENEGRAKNLDKKRKRPVNVVDFEKSERLIRVIS